MKGVGITIFHQHEIYVGCWFHGKIQHIDVIQIARVSFRSLMSQEHAWWYFLIEQYVSWRINKAHFFVCSFAAARNLALSFFKSYDNRHQLIHVAGGGGTNTAAISGSNGSSALGLLTFSWMIARTITSSLSTCRHHSKDESNLPEDSVTEGFHWKFTIEYDMRSLGRENPSHTSSLRTGTHMAPSSLIPGW